MSILVIPTGNAPFSQRTTTLEGTAFLLNFQYNQRCACFYLSLADASGVDIYNGVKLICGVGLLRKCADPRKPAGELFVLSATADRAPPGLQDLVAGSGRCKLLYITSDWLALLAADLASGTTTGADTIRAQIATHTVHQTGSTYGQA